MEVSILPVELVAWGKNLTVGYTRVNPSFCSDDDIRFSAVNQIVELTLFSLERLKVDIKQT